MTARLPENTNLSYYVNNDYRGLPLLKKCYPYIEDYLERCYDVLMHALLRYPSVTGIRFDLHYPGDSPLPANAFSNTVMSRFIKTLRERIARDQLIASREGKRVHMTELDYVWVREIAESQRPHYHVMVFLNNQAFMSLGDPSKDWDNMAKRIRDSWAKALGLDYDTAKYLVHFSEYSSHCILRNDRKSIEDAFRALSYCCKAYSKQYGHPGHSFGSSQLRE